ncbi:hypothetical protein [uncultured Eudoraea sp.]|nr:hypothetical protein [uncultured Eudoraea sp.]
MKLLIVTVVEQFEEAILELFKKAKIENFSGSENNPIKAIVVPIERSI